MHVLSLGEGDVWDIRVYIRTIYEVIWTAFWISGVMSLQIHSHDFGKVPFWKPCAKKRVLCVPSQGSWWAVSLQPHDAGGLTLHNYIRRGSGNWVMAVMLLQKSFWLRTWYSTQVVCTSTYWITHETTKRLARNSNVQISNIVVLIGEERLMIANIGTTNIHDKTKKIVPPLTFLR